MPPPAAFYCVTDSRYFLGAVATVNSLRLLGHEEPIHVLDCGLTEHQRGLIEPHVTLVAAPQEAPPWLLKTVAPLEHPADVMVLIDADIIVTRSLADLIEEAAQPRVIAIENDTDRFVPEWGELLGLGEVRRQPYVSSGLVFLGDPLGREILTAMGELQGRVDFDRSFWRGNDPDYPFLYGDQDVLNAILASGRVEGHLLDPLPNRLVPNPPFEGVRIEDRQALRCAHSDGTELYALHNFYRKPWLVRTRSNPYSRLMTRVLLEPDVQIRLDRSELPLRLRDGMAATLARLAVDVGIGVPAYVHRRVSPGPRGHKGWADPTWSESRGSEPGPR
ncbi:MAG: hypothetical protein ACRDK1_06565 [Solirubrobacterales bacterium]